jgi:hypothetical protein
MGGWKPKEEDPAAVRGVYNGKRNCFAIEPVTKGASKYKYCMDVG